MPEPFNELEINRTAAPLRQQVLDRLRRAIISGRLAPGQRLTERDLTTMMAVSRTVVREALRQLETEGLVAIIPNKGPVVRELSPGEAKDLYRIRGVLEGLAARLFAENADTREVEALEAALAAVVSAYDDGDVEGILAAKNRFYDVLNGGADSETLATMVATLHARIWRWRAHGLTHPNRSPQRSRESLRNLEAMLEAIKAGDADAAERIIREETRMAADEVTRLLSPEGAAPAHGHA